MRRRIHGSTEGGCQLSSLTALDDPTTVWINEGWAADIIYHRFSRAFDTFFSCVLVNNLSYHRMDGGPPGWLELEHLSCSMRLRGWFSQEIKILGALKAGAAPGIPWVAQKTKANSSKRPMVER